MKNAKSEMTIFKFNDKHQVRTMTIKGEPWFVAVDACRVLGVGNTTEALRTLSKDEKDIRKVDTLGGSQKTNIISESGLYKLIMRSNKPQAKSFQDWVTKIVLPAIRKDGGYILGEEKVFTGEMSEDELVRQAMAILNRKCQRLQEERDSQAQTIEEHIKYVTVDEFRALNHLYMPKWLKMQLGQAAYALMLRDGITPKKQQRSLQSFFGEIPVSVNVYPLPILEEAAECLGIQAAHLIH